MLPQSENMVLGRRIALFLMRSFIDLTALFPVTSEVGVPGR